MLIPAACGASLQAGVPGAAAWQGAGGVRVLGRSLSAFDRRHRNVLLSERPLCELLREAPPGWQRGVLPPDAGGGDRAPRAPGGLSLAPEPIQNTDGAARNDCEREASKRLIADVGREHPHLKLIVLEDGLASNAPHIGKLRESNSQTSYTSRRAVLKGGVAASAALAAPTFAVNMLSLVRVKGGDRSRAGPWRRRGSLRWCATWFPCAGKLAGRQPLAKSGWLLLPCCARRCDQGAFGRCLEVVPVDAKASVDTGFEDAELAKLA